MSKELTRKQFKQLTKLNVMALRVTALKAETFGNNEILYSLFIAGVQIQKDYILGKKNILSDIKNRKFSIADRIEPYVKIPLDPYGLN